MILTQQQLVQTFSDNFVAYSRAHIAHINVVGRNFYSDHKLLGKIYEKLQADIDVLGELVRSSGTFVPQNLTTMIVDSAIDEDSMRGTADDMLFSVRDNLAEMVSSYQVLSEVASDDDAEEVENFAQEQVLLLNKYIWMLDSTLMPDLHNEDA
jgi:DNA-binding ferritin-like protein